MSVVVSLWNVELVVSLAVALKSLNFVFGWAAVLRSTSDGATTWAASWQGGTRATAGQGLYSRKRAVRLSAVDDAPVSGNLAGGDCISHLRNVLVSQKLDCAVVTADQARSKSGTEHAERRIAACIAQRVVAAPATRSGSKCLPCSR